jgi:hypothetical protein
VSVWAFQHLDFDSLFLTVTAGNIASERVAAKARFVFVEGLIDCAGASDPMYADQVTRWRRGT